MIKLMRVAMSIILMSIFFSLSRARISATRNRGKMLPLNAESGD